MRLVTLLLNNKPIRKVVAAAVVSGLVYLAHRLGLSVEDKALDEAVSSALVLLAAYWTPDPRVRG